MLKKFNVKGCMVNKVFKVCEQNSLLVSFMGKVDYHKVVLPFVEEALGLATLLIPEPKLESIRITTDVEAAELNTERIKLVKKLLIEVKKDTACPRCMEHLQKAEEEVDWLEKQVPQYERIARLRQNLRDLLDQIKTDLPLLPEKPELEKQQMKGLEGESKVAESKST